MPSLIGNKPNQVSTNGDLGTLAFQDANAVNIQGGIVDVSAGSATVASFGAAGDENTGLFFPAADTIAVTTGGTERVRVTSTGNVGIGKNNPTAPLDVNGSIFTGVTTAGQVVAAFNGDSTNLQRMQITTSGTNGVLQATRSSGTVPNMLFQIDSNERMRITDTGNVGIGTSSAISRVTVQGTPNTRLMQFYTNGANADYSAIGNQYSSASAFCASEIRFGNENTSSGTGFISLATGTNTVTERVRIDSTGNLGIATASPTAMLDVNSNTVRVRTARTPASATATGNAGDICWDANYVYVCVATNTWKRSALSTW